MLQQMLPLIIKSSSFSTATNEYGIYSN